jgi:V/A-type H+-transporting ATPase subunit I
MAVSRMKKIQLLAHKSVKAEVVAALREGGVLHIVEPSIELSAPEHRTSPRASRLELSNRLAKLEHLRAFLKPHAPKRKPLDAMFNPKLLLSTDELQEILAGFDVDGLYERATGLEGKMRSGEAEAARKDALANELSHWEGLEMPVENVVDTHVVRVSLASMEAAELQPLAAELSEAAPESDLLEVSRSGSTVYAVAIFLASVEPAVAQLLKRHNVRWVDVSGAAGMPADAVEQLLAEADEIRRAAEAVKKEIVELAKEYDKVLVVLDETAEELAKAEADESFGATEQTFLVEGWIRSRDEAGLRERLAEVAPETHVAARAPEEGDDVPIDLRNNSVVTPFEFVTTLYGRPVYWEFDPTPLLAPFFIVFFGLCVSDGGYGLILAALSFVLMRKMQPGGGRKLMQLLMMGGLATAAVGAVTGGWFGIDPGVMPQWLASAIVLNPLEEPMKMLNVVFIVGIVQIFTGLAIKMVSEFKEKRWLDGILDQLVWIAFLSFLVPLGYDFILGGEVPEGVATVAARGAMAMGLIVVLTGARKNKNPIMKVLGGVLKLYDVVGYFGDVLSYARLLALGLATGAIAMAINGVAEMAMGIPIAGPVAAVVILIGGHLFNLAVNCLGGFVHSGRLQYLEYFSKFFQGGGRAFAPFRTEKKYSIVRE